MTSHLFLIGVDKTQSIAMDELWNQKPKDALGVARDTQIYKKTKMSERQTL
jgi:hypothetical protein